MKIIIRCSICNANQKVKKFASDDGFKEMAIEVEPCERCISNKSHCALSETIENWSEASQETFELCDRPVRGNGIDGIDGSVIKTIY